MRCFRNCIRFAAATVVAGATSLVLVGCRDQPRGASMVARPSRAVDTTVTAQAAQAFADCDDEKLCPIMVRLPAGSFLMGSAANERGRFDDEGPQRQVAIRPVAVGKHPVTRGQWAAFALATSRPVPQAECAYAMTLHPSWKDPGYPQGDDHPVVCITWQDARDYAAWLTERTGHHYRLLSESEWEYAARAGTTTAFPWGAAASHEFANYGRDSCCGPATVGKDRWQFTSPVGSFPPNAFGLYDMHGNVFEWVQDCHAGSYAGHTADGSSYETPKCKYRVGRGGVYGDRPAVMRSAARNFAPGPGDMTIANYRSSGFGARVARDLP
jgi:formylglycine-generating enzyme required for sulfatase activity